MAITVTGANPRRVTAESSSTTTNETYPAIGSNDARNYVIADDILGTVNTGVQVDGFGLRLQTTAILGGITMNNNGAISASELGVNHSALELVGNGGPVNYSGSNGRGFIANHSALPVTHGLGITNVGAGGI